MAAGTGADEVGGGGGGVMRSSRMGGGSTTRRSRSPKPHARAARGCCRMCSVYVGCGLACVSLSHEINVEGDAYFELSGLIRSAIPIPLESRSFCSFGFGNVPVDGLFRRSRDWGDGERSSCTFRLFGSLWMLMWLLATPCTRYGSCIGIGGPNVGEDCCERGRPCWCCGGGGGLLACPLPMRLPLLLLCSLR